MITVIIPAYNAQKTIQRCIASVVEQNAEVKTVLADDGSEDNTLNIAKQFGDRIQIISLPHRGVSAARNAGLAAANTEWIMFLDADDALLPDALAKLEPYLTEDVDAVCGKICRGKGKTNARDNVLAYSNGHELMDFVLSDPTNYLTVHAWVFRRKPDMPSFDTALRVGEDSDWVLRFLYGARQVFFVPLPVYRYTVSADSTIHKWRAGQDRDYLKMIAKLGREEVGQEKNWPLFVLTNYLLVLTHVVFHPGNPHSGKEQFRDAQKLRDDLMVADAFEKGDLSSMSRAKRIVLGFLKRRQFLFAWLAVKARQRKNCFLAEA